MSPDEQFALDEYTTAVAGRLEMILTALTEQRGPAGEVDGDLADRVVQHLTGLAEAMHAAARSAEILYPRLPALTDLPPLRP